MSVINRDEKITDNFKIESELGRGSFAIVKEAMNKKTGAKVAIKIIEK
jgi:serine/threonine protein kinase